MLPTRLRGARTHNLCDVDLDLEPGQLVAITGPSGAGKSSLAFDTLYAEGQRRFVESFSPYARQFLERLERPPMRSLEPVPAGIAVDRRAPVKSSRSTVATMADLEPYLAALFGREAAPVCPEHGAEAVELDALRAASRAVRDLGGERAVVAYPLRVRDADGYLEVRERLVAEGWRRLWLDGEAVDIDRVKPSAAVKAKALGVVVDRATTGDSDAHRIAAAVESAWARASGHADIHGAGRTLTMRRGLSCPECARQLDPPRIGFFSYESPLGACAECRGFGRTIGLDLDKVIPDPKKTLARGAVRPWSGKSTEWERGELEKLCKRHRVPMDRAWQSLTDAQRALVVGGDGSWHKGLFPGIRGWFAWLETRTYKMHVRVLLSRYRAYDPCKACGGRRLNTHALSYRVGGIDIAAWHALEIGEARARLDALTTTTLQGDLARRELESRLGYLERVGLGYLTLDRQARTLSGGEAQRVTLTAALGTSLHNALFVLDEPSVGLHPTDLVPLGEMLRELSDRNSAVLLVEHDPALIRAADRVIELGPGAGADGGHIVADGTPAEVVASGGATARALAPRRAGTRTPREPRAWLTVKNARENNLVGTDARLPLGVVCAVTGPSGSGKSTLAVDIVWRALARRLGELDVEQPGAHDGIDGAEAVRRIELVDQAPLGRTSRGNAATYTKAWDRVRELYAGEAAAVGKSFGASHFSFNVEGGRCEACSGDGWETVEMQFLADVRLVCPACKGRRFKDDVLAIVHRGCSVADLLERTVSQALETFRDEAAVFRALAPLERLGLGYLRLGQPLSTLSGGEAQRLKLARALGSDPSGTLFVLDEPSAGLHVDEVGALLGALDRIVEAGGSVLVVEHDLDVVRAADWVVDLGPGAGTRGGQIVAEGVPADVARAACKTGEALRAASQPVAKHTNGSARASARAVRARAPASVEVTRAREHNLKEVSVSIPHGALSVVTGPSGSGKSTLAFDVVFAEGQRRFLETLTPYARQFLPTMPRPDVDAVTGVPPAIALEQRTSRAGGKSTVATVTEVAHYLRLVYAKLGVAHCPDHDLPIERRSVEEVVRALRALRGKHALLAPVVQARKGTYLDVFAAAARGGIAAAVCDGQIVATDDPPRLSRNREHTIDLFISEAVEPSEVPRAIIDRALVWGSGALKLRGRGGERLLSTRSACPTCNRSVPELDPRWFSFATRQGRCETCEGEGVVPESGAPVADEKKRRTRRGRPKKAAREDDGPKKTCPDCGGTRLGPVPRSVRLDGERYPEFSGRSVAAALERVKEWRFAGDAAKIGGPVASELERRLAFLCDVGLDYLALDRPARTLSGGEMQRLRLAAQLGAGLTGALYVLDEPTIGLHPRDTARLLGNLRALVDLGSTVLVVEHDADTIRAADHLVDLGPGGGREGGSVVAVGTPREVLANPSSPTGRALSHPPELRAPLRIEKSAACLELLGASEHNLRDVDARIPLGRFSVVAGVSGSGKSTLISKVLLPALRQKLGLVDQVPGAHRSLGDVGPLRRAIAVDQSPIGRTPRSVPATFLGIWDEIRRLYARAPDAQVAGFAPSRFSFNTEGGGRCNVCQGQGAITHEMSFLPDVVTTCSGCSGLRFEPRTLQVRWQGLSIGQVLDLSADEAARLFTNHPRIAAPLRTLVDLGAGYVKVGQGSHTLSGGEAQRLKLAAELTAGGRHEPTLYVLDEPTTGLHLADVARLVSVLSRLVERGDTLVVIEHHPVVIAGADWVIELGPGGGDRGGRIVAQGPPATLAKKKTATGLVVKETFAA